MSTERIIKKQALSYLSQDNWATAIGGFFILLLPPILIILFAGVCESISEYFSLGNFETPAIILINILIILLYIFSTTIITGYLRLC
jgi:phage shock protein PspC (stress-responsive transcriptional regulator)